MKKLMLILFIGFISASTFGQNVKHSNENADSLKHNSIGLNISPFLSFVLSGAETETVKTSILYKHYGERLNLRLGASFLPDVNKKNFYTTFNDAGFSYEAPSVLEGGDVVNITDSTLMKRHFLKENYLFELNIGLEKARHSRIGTGILGAELNLAYYHKDETYLYRDYILPIEQNDSQNFTEYPFLLPNAAAPYSTGEYLKLGLNFIFGFEWNLTKHLNISSYLSPNVFVLVKLKEAYSDNNNYLTHTEYNTIQVEPGFLNVTASLKF